MSGMIICLGRLLPAASSDLPEAGGPRHCFCSVLLRMGFTCALSVTRKAVVSYTALPPLPAPRLPAGWRYISVVPYTALPPLPWQKAPAVYFCCTILGVASTGRYPASCPVKPGLSSPAAFRHMQLRSFILLAFSIQSQIMENVKYFFRNKLYQPLLYMKTASPDKFP